MTHIPSPFSDKKCKRKLNTENTPIQDEEMIVETKSPKRNFTGIPKPLENNIVSPIQRNLVKRNLNESFGSPSKNSKSILDYSIVSDEDCSNPLKMKLRVSRTVSTESRAVPVRRSTRLSKVNYKEIEVSPIKKPRASKASTPVRDSPIRRGNTTKAPTTPKVIKELTVNIQNLGLSPEKFPSTRYRTRSNSRSESEDFTTPSSRKKINLDDSIRTTILKSNLSSKKPEKKPSPQRKTRGRSFYYYESYSSSSDGEVEEILNKRNIRTPKRYLETPTNDEKSPEQSTPRKSLRANKAQTPKSTPGNRAKLIREGIITPSMQSRKNHVEVDKTPLMKAMTQLHVAYVPKALSCREKEFEDLYKFLEGKLLDGCGGCMYVSGVPGTGKTATVTAVVNSLMYNKRFQGKFDFVSINGMRLTEPRQAYVEILKQLTNKTLPWEQAQSILEQKFTKTKSKSPVILLVDELDILCTKRQDVVYNLLDWPTKAKTQLVVITIANTMDLPERLLMNRVTSRLGLTRLTFQAYTFKQLQEIVTKRLIGTKSFNSDAVQFVARKVASVSGDARRALDICRRAAEIAQAEDDLGLVKMQHVNEALNCMITQPKVVAIKRCSRLEKLFLQSVVAEVERTGVEETTFEDVYKMLVSIAALDGFKMPGITATAKAVNNLTASRLILSDQKTCSIHRKIILNVSGDDVFYAVKND